MLEKQYVVKFISLRDTDRDRQIKILSKYDVCNSKKSKFIKEREAGGLLSSLGRKTPLSKVPLVGPLLL